MFDDWLTDLQAKTQMDMWHNTGYISSWNVALTAEDLQLAGVQIGEQDQLWEDPLPLAGEEITCDGIGITQPTLPNMPSGNSN